MSAGTRRSLLLRQILCWAAAAFSLCVAIVFVRAAAAQEPAALSDEESVPPTAGSKDGKWRAKGVGISRDTLTRPGDVVSDAISSDDAPRPLSRHSIAEVDDGPASLPDDAGQVWRSYNIRPYTVRVTTTNRPEQAIVDWVLRETGYETWHSETAAVLFANAQTLTAYHTPEIQAVVADVVDRFVSSEAESHVFGLRVVSVGNPNWRAKAQPILHPVPVQTQGLQAWLLHKEDAALLLSDLRRRMDFREYSSPHLVVNNGQSTTVAATRPQGYIKDVLLHSNTWPAFEPQTAQFDEGFSLELSPLLSLDNRMIDAVIKCNIDQLERLVPVTIDVPHPAARNQRARIDVPQISHCRLHERFRWPADQVLVVDMGVVATPVPTRSGSLLSSLPFLQSPPRADLLVLIESRGTIGENSQTARTSLRDAKTYRGRY